MPLNPRLTPGASPGNTKLASAFLILSVLAICLATLRPSGGTLAPGWTLSLATGDEALAEIIQNLLLFIPFGAALALRSPSPERRGGQGVRVLAAGVALSFSVEFAQQWLPGRDPSVGDIINNAASTLLGAALVWTAPRWLNPAPHHTRWLSLGAALVAAVAWLGTGWLFQPAFPDAVYFDHWTPDIPKWPNYRGKVVAAELGSVVLRDGPIDRLQSHLGPQLLAADAPLRITAVAGPPPRGSAPLLTISDVDQTDIFIVGVDHTDLLLVYRNHAAALTLAHPSLRAPHALSGVQRGDTFTVVVTRECINRTCSLGHTVGDAWQLIFFPRSFSPWALGVFNALWIGGGLLGVGLWGRRDRTTGIALLVAVVTLAVGPSLVGLKATPPTEWLGAVAGFVMGNLVWRGRRRVSFPRARAL